MKTRLIRNWATTVLGVAIWVYVGYVIMQAQSAGQDLQGAATAMLPYMGLGTLLLRSKDSLIGLAAKENPPNESA